MDSPGYKSDHYVVLKKAFENIGFVVRKRLATLINRINTKIKKSKSKVVPDADNLDAQDCGKLFQEANVSK